MTVAQALRSQPLDPHQFEHRCFKVTVHKQVRPNGTPLGWKWSAEVIDDSFEPMTLDCGALVHFTRVDAENAARNIINDVFGD